MHLFVFRFLLAFVMLLLLFVVVVVIMCTSVFYLHSLSFSMIGECIVTYAFSVFAHRP